MFLVKSLSNKYNIRFKSIIYLRFSVALFVFSCWFTIHKNHLLNFSIFIAIWMATHNKTSIFKWAFWASCMLLLLLLLLLLCWVWINFVPFEQFTININQTFFTWRTVFLNKIRTIRVRIRIRIRTSRTPMTIQTFVTCATSYSTIAIQGAILKIQVKHPLEDFFLFRTWKSIKFCMMFS